MTDKKIEDYINEGGIRLFRCLDVIAENISEGTETLDFIADVLKEDSSVNITQRDKLGRMADALEENSSVNIAQRDNLERIANALEGIEQSLDSISSSLADMASTNPLDDCISKTRAGSALCVTGNITNYEY